ncbi:MAG TPA: valine--tRNA ligase [Phycisphaerales bacterium]|nr:valine--tRNA ligase [Phycisphaerales bacterium]
MTTTPLQPAGQPASDLPKTYKPSEHESAAWDLWVRSGCFRAEPSRVLSGEKKPYAIVIPPPNVTAALHLGHALNNTLQDVLARAHRMMGDETLWMPGTDHAGIATQAVVEKRLRKEGKLKGPLKTSMTREEFLGHLTSFKDEYEATITNQLKKMGCSCDWDRQRFTMDEQCAAAVREAFFRLFKDGLIYRGKRLVNWDPALQTAVADDECYDEEIEGAFYYLRYPVVRKHGGEDPALVTWDELARLGYPGAGDEHGDARAWVTVATTRPETYLGDTAVAINPHDPRAQALRGLSVELPLVGRIIPIIEDPYVVLPERYARTEEEKNDPKASMATGFLKVTPAHDPNDYEIGQRHNLPIVNVMAPDASISDKHGWSDIGDAQVFVGKKREDARKLVVMEFEARGLFEGSKPHRHSVKHSDRSKAAIEPYLSDQWYVKVTDPRMAGSANAALRSECGAGVSPATESSIASSPAVDKHLTMRTDRLPHWQRGGCTLFVTFRTERGELSPEEREITLAACRHWHSVKMELHAAVVMPDHVHLMFSPFEESPGNWYSMSELLHSIKSYSAHAIAKRRGNGGPVWQNESYDRIVREGAWAETAEYIALNPVRKQLVQHWREYAYTWYSDAMRAGKYEFPERVKGGSLGSTKKHTTVSKDQSGAGGRRDACPTPPKLSFHPSRYAKTYEQWHDNIRDWCISRQLWWGHRIPVWHLRFPSPWDPTLVSDLEGNLIDHGVDHAIDGEIPDVAVQVVDAHSGERLSLPEFKRLAKELRTDSDRQFGVYMCILNPDYVKYFEDKGFIRDPDVLDTWFSSALWPMSTMGWPEPRAHNAESNAGLLDAFNPTSVLCTAREIITLWVSRMVMFNRYFMGEGQGRGPVPFHDVYIHAVIQDGEGRKMSKSLGNGVDPLDIIETHGADAMRFTLAHMATNTQDVRMPVKRDPASGKNTSEKFDMGRNFANKLWNAARFALNMLPARGSASPAPPLSASSLLDRWMLSRLHAGVAAANGSLANYDFHEYAQALYDLTWRDFCDWYLEGVKPTIAQDAAQQAVLRAALDTILRLAHPVMPFVTETIYQRLRSLPTVSVTGVVLAEPEKGGTLCTAGWPALDEALRDERAIATFERVRELVGAIRDIRAKQQVKPARRITLHAPAGSIAHDREAAPLIRTFAGLEAITADRGAKGEIAFTIGGVEFALSDVRDESEAGDAAEAERARLAKLVGDLERSVATLAGRLANPGYAERAPAAMVQQTRDQLARAESDLGAARQSLAALGLDR